MSKLSYAELKGLASKEIPEADPDIMAAIALAESGGNTDAISPTHDYGLWQINKKVWQHESNLFGTGSGKIFFALGRWKGKYYNAMAARTVYRKQGYAAWSTYKSGAYQKYLQKDTPGEGGGIPFTPDSGVGNAVNPIGSVVGSALLTIREYATVGAIAIAGFVLVVFAVAILLRKPVGDIASVAPTGRVLKAVKAAV